MQDCQKNGIQNVEIDDIYLGNGVSELIATALQALVNTDDEVLVPAPDYPLWTAAVSLCGGNPVHYTCDEKANWYPDIDDIRKKISPRTKALVIINPNNPTGSVYSKDLLLSLIEIARKNQLIVFADEIYSKIVYEDVQHLPVASLCEDVFVVSFNGLSKSYRLAGFRSGWMILHGPKAVARDYIEGLNILASMRLCANVPAQFAVQTALGGYQSINDLVMPKGRLEVQREKMWMLLNEISGVSCVKPMGAIYMFVGIDPKKYKINDDEELVLRLLQREHLLVVQGSAFNIKDSQHLRLVFLPRTEQIEIAVEKFARVLDSYR
jgi:alanine-synthesizing transaminase